MLNGCRVDVRQSELAPIAIDDEASKKSVSMVYYESHNYAVRKLIVSYHGPADLNYYSKKVTKYWDLAKVIRVYLLERLREE